MFSKRLVQTVQIRRQVRAISRKSPAGNPFTSHDPSTAALFRSHGYDPTYNLLHRIPWNDQDSYGHVNNVHYLRCPDILFQ